MIAATQQKNGGHFGNRKSLAYMQGFFIQDLIHFFVQIQVIRKAENPHYSHHI
ncbi:hypothetical protein P4U88_25740 [Bacillus paramycoides]|uniref:Uncharacterized protein n=1 Tax=Bacillus paramycoides TaxID=2026194 RepID=A0ABU6N2L1_9BACI|nr:hypothetical protein [Bacillus paramycoides]